ncbi:hypothetical protein COO91_06576 [Nostoc flagelliforme CCNUN1]|uniref:Uncharacterized protein n=1 Tax=Nostoc flagelliforme CCNUN1 TaxID=2038116 RepID=A0A2K8SYN5_9NOSO|nr:hypothetical protein COO91_06576 [Nostoc flagelliforme CCNUN1]
MKTSQNLFIKTLISLFFITPNSCTDAINRVSLNSALL